MNNTLYLTLNPTKCFKHLLFTIIFINVSVNPSFCKNVSRHIYSGKNVTTALVLQKNDIVTSKNKIFFASTYPGLSNTEFANNIVDIEIQTEPISPATYCSGGVVNVSYTALINFYGGNIFTAELSDAIGSFANPVSIGSNSAPYSGSINAIIP